MKALARIFAIMAARQSAWMIAGIAAGMLVLASNMALMAFSGWFITSMAVAGATKISFNYILPALAIRVLALIRTLGRYVERLATHEAAFRMLADLRVWLFDRLIPLAPAGLEGYAGGDLSGRLRADVDNLENLYLRIIAPIAGGLAVIILAPLCLFIWSPAGALVLFAALIASGIVLPLASAKMAVLPGKRSVELSAELRTVVTEGLQGAEELLLLGAADEQAERVESLYGGIASEQRGIGRINGVTIGGVAASAGISLAVLLAIVAPEVSAGTVSGPQLVMLLLFCTASFEGIAPLSAALQLMPATIATAGRLDELAETPCPVPETANPAPPPSGGEVVFSHVDFAYGEGACVLKDFSLVIPEGSRVAITGQSGMGKSTIVELLLRFRPYRGSISIGGTDLPDIAAEDIPKLITAMPQRPHLFNQSIRDNILLGNPDADECRIMEALQDSGLSAWVATLPEGLDTKVGVAGSAVSGGETRRIALARTLVHDAPIVILDEPTEGLDAETESTVVARLDKRLQGKTVLLITHRPACLTLAERIIRI